MLGYLHHALNFLQLNMVKGKSHQANGVVVKSNLVAANKRYQFEKAQTTSSSQHHVQGRRAPPQGSRREIKGLYAVFLSNIPQCISLRSNFPPTENMSHSFLRHNKSNCSSPKCCNEGWLFQGWFTKPGVRL